MAAEHVGHHGQVELGDLRASASRRHADADGPDDVGDHHIVGRLCCVVDLLAECAALHLGQHAGVAVGDQQLVGGVLARHDETVRRLVLDELIDLAAAQMPVLRVREQRGGRDAGGGGCARRRLCRLRLADLALLRSHRRRVFRLAVALLRLRLVLRHGHRPGGDVGLRLRPRNRQLVDAEGHDVVGQAERNGERLRAVDERAVLLAQTQLVPVLDELTRHSSVSRSCSQNTMSGTTSTAPPPTGM